MKIKQRRKITITLTENEFWAVRTSIEYAIKAAMELWQPIHTITVQSNLELMQTLYKEMEVFESDR